jgi:hypothetical protein
MPCVPRSSFTRRQLLQPGAQYTVTGELVDEASMFVSLAQLPVRFSLSAGCTDKYSQHF